MSLTLGIHSLLLENLEAGHIQENITAIVNIAIEQESMDKYGLSTKVHDQCERRKLGMNEDSITESKWLKGKGKVKKVMKIWSY